MSVDACNPRRVQATLVAMMFDPGYAARVRDGREGAGLSARERAMLAGVDPRALTADPYRRARAVTALLDEYPVTIALIGVAGAEPFFASAEFRAIVNARGSMAIAFGRWVGKRAGGIGPLEHALAEVRRPHLLSAGVDVIACAANVRTRILASGTLAYHADARGRLGPDLVARLDLAALLAKGHGFALPRVPDRGAEYVLVESRPDGSVDVGTASEALVRLLVFAERGKPRAAVRTEAARLGATPEEADELIDDLVSQGLLVVL